MHVLLLAAISAEVATVILALGTFIGTVVAAYRGLRTDRATQEEKEEASALAGYQALAIELRSEIARLRSEFEADRQRWASERNELATEVVALRRRVRELESGTD